jgi:hypothetical protein
MLGFEYIHPKIFQIIFKGKKVMPQPECAELAVVILK